MTFVTRFLEQISKVKTCLDKEYSQVLLVSGAKLRNAFNSRLSSDVQNAWHRDIGMSFLGNRGTVIVLRMPVPAYMNKVMYAKENFNS